jgi:hypothetical protein
MYIMKSFPATTILSILFLGSGLAVAQQTDTTATDTTGAEPDSSLVSELAAEMESTEDSSSDESGPSGQTTSRSLTAMNPEISLIGDFRGWYATEPIGGHGHGEDEHGDEEHGHEEEDHVRNVDLEFNHLEAAFISDVDPYARAEIYIGAHPEGEGFHFGLEEAYVESLGLPYRLQLKAGKFRSSFGKINHRHPHSLPYIGVPLIYRRYLGPEGLNDMGLSLSWLVPTPFYQEIILEATSGPHNPSFAPDEENRLFYTGRLRNFWDLSEASTIELGLNAASGTNDLGLLTNLGGVDLTYIWKPLRYNTYNSFELQSELFYSNRELPASGEINTWGMYVMGKYQFARRWYLIGRYDHTDQPTDDHWNENATSLTVSWYATEFQKVELGLERYSGDERKTAYQGIVRLVFVIGAHGAHEY